MAPAAVAAAPAAVAGAFSNMPKSVAFLAKPVTASILDGFPSERIGCMRANISFHSRLPPSAAANAITSTQSVTMAAGVNSSMGPAASASSRNFTTQGGHLIA